MANDGLGPRASILSTFVTGPARVILVLLKRRTTFENIARKPDYVGPSLTVIGLVIGTTVYGQVLAAKLVFTGQSSASLTAQFAIAISNSIFLSVTSTLVSSLTVPVLLYRLVGRKNWQGGFFPSLSIYGYSLTISLVFLILKTLLVSIFSPTIIIDTESSSGHIHSQLESFQSLVKFGPIEPVGWALFIAEFVLRALWYSTGVYYATNRSTAETAFYAVLLLGLLGFFGLLIR